jgi:hypothetical protein
VTNAITYLAVPLMVLALFDPLDGGALIALLGLPVAVVAFMRHSRARWLIVSGLILFAAAFTYMTVAGRVVPVLQNPSLVPWLAAALLTVAGGIWLLRDVLADHHSRAAIVIPALLVLLAIVLTARVATLLGGYRPWAVAIVAMAETASVDGPPVGLALGAAAAAVKSEE